MRVIIVLLLVIILSLNVSAISVASDYLVNNTLELIGGISKIYSIRLQNPTDNEVGIKLDYDNAFINVIDYKELYILPPKTNSYKILFNVTASQKPGTYIVEYTVGEVEPAGGGGVPIRLKINKNFKLKVIEDPNKSHINYNYLVYAAMALVFLLYFFRKKLVKKRIKKRSRNKYKKL